MDKGELGLDADQSPHRRKDIGPPRHKPEACYWQKNGDKKGVGCAKPDTNPFGTPSPLQLNKHYLFTSNFIFQPNKLNLHRVL